MTTLRDLKTELKSALRGVVYAQREMKMANDRVSAAQKAINDYKVTEKAKRVPLPIGFKTLSSKQRYDMFNEMIFRHGHHGTIYRDRVNGITSNSNDVSVKIQLKGLALIQARALADKVSVTKHAGKDCWSYYCIGSGKVHRIERYIFRNVLTPKKQRKSR